MNKVFLLVINLLVYINLHAQTNEKYSASDIQQSIKKLNVLGSVLYIAAHPDDENTKLITWFSKERLYNTAYLSLTRGDGGQNLIGPELYDELGLIRTQELLQARRIDGGKQYFSRARDFGFSKNPDETFTIWDHDKVLADMVWVIRKFKPDVMITRFNTEPGKTHGHHTASSILASEAFTAAADPNRFPEQLKYVDVWQAKRLLWNTNSWFYSNPKDFKAEEFLKIDVGDYNNVLGSSYTEIAACSRSMHKSQGFGASGTRGSSLEYLQHTLGPKAEKDIFEDIDVSWSRIKGSENVAALLKKAQENFKINNPAESVDILLEAREALKALPDSYWKNIKLTELEDVIKTCLGLWTEATSSEYSAIPGQTIKINIEAINRSNIKADLIKVSLMPNIKDTLTNTTLNNNTSFVFSTKINIPENFNYSQPYWLTHKGTKGMFEVDDQKLIGLPENPPVINVQFEVNIKGKSFVFNTPLIYKKTDPVKGEQYRPFVVTPALFINPSEDLLVFGNSKSKELQIIVKSGTDKVSGNLILSVPNGWSYEPKTIPFKIEGKGSEQKYNFKIYPGAREFKGEVKVLALLNSDTIDKGVTSINYDHIPAQTLFPQSSVKVVKVDLKKKGERIGYIMGAGDDIPSCLKQIGYNVSEIREENVSTEYLKSFDAIVIGIRAFNTRERLRAIHPSLLQYVKDGGTLVVQYTTLPGRLLENKIVTDSIGPYPFKLSNDRVTNEDAPIKFINSTHTLLNTPNKITDKDFEGWIQERGLYFPNEWDKRYETIISCNDPGETPKDSGILYTKYGKGVFIYTTYSWFRELPAGVPGAYRLFVNLISASKK